MVGNNAESTESLKHAKNERVSSDSVVDQWHVSNKGANGRNSI